MALGAEVVDFVRAHFLNDAAQIGGIRQVAEMETEADILLVRVLIEMVDTGRVERGGTPFQPVHAIALVEQKFAQISAVLSGHADDESRFSCKVFPPTRVSLRPC